MLHRASYIADAGIKLPLENYQFPPRSMIQRGVEWRDTQILKPPGHTIPRFLGVPGMRADDKTVVGE